MNSYNDNLREVFKLINSLASINNTKHEAEQAKMFVKENWEKFLRDFKSTPTIRYPTGRIERVLFKLIANVCDWKTNKDYMRTASQIMILCGYHSYEKNKNRFKQKIENMKKKNKKKIKMSTMTIVRIIIRTSIRNINEKERKRLQLIKRSNSEEKRTRVFSNKDGSDQQMMNQDDNIHSEDDTDENVVGRDDQFQNNQHPNINNENPSPQPTDNPSENNTDNEQGRVQENSVNNDEQMWETICPNNLDLSTLSNPCENPAYQQNLSDSVNNSFNIQLLKV